MTLLNSSIGTEVFLQGNFLSVGFNSSGTIGTNAVAPTGFITDAQSGYIRLGLVGDTDGFNTGAAATHDAMLRGTPIEGFSVGYKTAGKTYVSSNNEQAGVQQIAGGTTSNVSTGDAAGALWTGATSEKVAISQTVTLSEDAKYMKFEVTLTNNSGAALDDLRYMRTIDPDHGSDYKTINTIVDQGGDNTGGALIAAYASKGSTPLFYYTQDERARVSTYGLGNFDPFASAAWSAAAATKTSVKADQSINIDFGLGQLAAGASTTFTFYLGITDDLNATVAAIKSAADAVPARNEAPITTDDFLTVDAAGTGRGNVLANDKDAEGAALTAKLVTGPAHGTLTLAADGSYVYKAAAGFSGQDSFVYTASDGVNATKATVSVAVLPPPNVAPTAIADTVATTGVTAVRGNVLSNDTDHDGDALTATLVSGPANGTLTLAADGSFQYVAKAGFSGTDSFTYAAGDGSLSSAATVSVSVAAPPEPTLPSLVKAITVLARDHQDGSAAGAQVLAGSEGQDVFFFNTSSKSGKDTITGFGHDDVLATSKALKDGNGDGIITFSKNALSLDTTGDSVTIQGVKALRYMGKDADGTYVYADAAVRPKGATESKIGAETLKGDTSDKSAQTFFFDTKLGLDLGADKITNFGAKDVIVTTTALTTTGDAKVATTGGALGLSDGIHDLGSATIAGIGGHAVSALEFDGAVQHDGVTYYVYSLEGSAAGTTNLTF